MEAHFLPQTLRSYALLADGERGALVGPRGDVAFLCAPTWHDDAVFSGVLGGPGHFAVTPTDDRFVWGGHYEEGGLVWRSRWVVDDTIVESREALAFPGDPRRLVLLRQIVATRGDACVRVLLDVRAGFGEHRMQRLGRDGGTWEGESGPLRFRLSGLPAAHVVDGGLVAEIEVPAGHRHDLVLEISPDPLPPAPSAAELWRTTEQAWHDTVPALEGSLAPGDARHAYAVLRGLTSHTGAMVAAATTSLPERADEGRNYDYRYAWIRDQSYAGLAGAAAGATDLLDSATRFVTERLLADGPDLRPAYTVAGGAPPDERTLDLSGYPGGNDRVGNRAGKQFQLDSVGDSLLLLAAAARHDRLDADGWAAAQVAHDVVRLKRDVPDAGIWELDDRWWAQSRLQCAAGLRAMAAARPGSATRGWAALADSLVDEAWQACGHPDGRWQRARDDERVDAALLLAGLRGAVPADDPRTVATWSTIRSELAADGYVYRFRHDDRPLHEAEGAFLFCGFAMAMATHQQGDPLRAVRWFERNRAAQGPPGLFAEEFDVVQRQLRGNLPQAFVHALLIESSFLLAQEPGTRQS